MANGHGGARPNTGGARPGAGRKTVAVEFYRDRNMRMLLETCDEAAARGIVNAAVSQAMDGDADARKWLGPYVFGAPPKEVTVTGDQTRPMRFEWAYVDETVTK